MKTIIRNLGVTLTVALFIGTSATTVVAGPSTGPTPILTAQQAKALPADAKCMMACTGCKTVQPINKSLLDWFKPSVKHDCPSCGGKVTFNGEKAGSGTKYTHSCTMCGPKSASVCTQKM